MSRMLKSSNLALHHGKIADLSATKRLRCASSPRSATSISNNRNFLPLGTVSVPRRLSVTLSPIMPPEKAPVHRASVPAAGCIYYKRRGSLAPKSEEATACSTSLPEFRKEGWGQSGGTAHSIRNTLRRDDSSAQGAARTRLEALWLVPWPRGQSDL